MLQAGCLQDAPPPGLSKNAVPFLGLAVQSIASRSCAFALSRKFEKVFACVSLPYFIFLTKQNKATRAYLTKTSSSRIF